MKGTEVSAGFPTKSPEDLFICDFTIEVSVLTFRRSFLPNSSSFTQKNVTQDSLI